MKGKLVISYGGAPFTLNAAQYDKLIEALKVLNSAPEMTAHAEGLHIVVES